MNENEQNTPKTKTESAKTSENITKKHTKPSKNKKQQNNPN